MKTMDGTELTVGQKWYRADAKQHGAAAIEVVDVTTYAYCDDVVVKDVTSGDCRRIDIHKLSYRYIVMA